MFQNQIMKVQYMKQWYATIIENMPEYASSPSVHSKQN